MIFLRSSILFPTYSKSLRHNSSEIIFISLTGSTLNSVWTISGSSKALTTWKIPSVDEMWDKKAFPSPSPFAAPETNPAISTIVKTADIFDLGLYN